MPFNDDSWWVCKTCGTRTLAGLRRYLAPKYRGRSLTLEQIKNAIRGMCYFDPYFLNSIGDAIRYMVTLLWWRMEHRNHTIHILVHGEPTPEEYKSYREVGFHHKLPDTAPNTWMNDPSVVPVD